MAEELMAEAGAEYLDLGVVDVESFCEAGE